MKCNFGKYSGREFENIPGEYLTRLSENATGFKFRARRIAQTEIKRRKIEIEKNKRIGGGVVYQELIKPMIEDLLLKKITMKITDLG